jgi:hypothetical protein
MSIKVPQGAAILQLLAGEDQTLLIRGDTLLVLNFLLHVIDRVAGLHIERDGLTGEGLNENLHVKLISRLTYINNVFHKVFNLPLNIPI